jgi:hypothetical protein
MGGTVVPIKNFTTKVPANRSIAEIQDCLVRHGATAVLLEYERGTGRIGALKFKMSLGDVEVPFSMPVEWRRFQAVLKEQRVSRWDDEDYCYRVAWRNVRDWVLSQMAFHETRMVELVQVFLPYAVTVDGTTMFDHVASGKLKLLQAVNT